MLTPRQQLVPSLEVPKPSLAEKMTHFEAASPKQYCVNDAAPQTHEGAITSLAKEPDERAIQHI